MGLNIGVVGATGAVGRKILDILLERKLDIEELHCFASERTAGEKLDWNGRLVVVELLTEEAMKQPFDYILFSAGGDISLKYAPIAQEAGNTVIDNSSQWRMTDGIPLIVPEVNGHTLRNYQGIIANPNCSTIQMVMALAPLHRIYKMNRIVVSTYQAVSGSGHKAIVELEKQMKDPEYPAQVYPKRIAANCIPHIDVFNENGFTKEELKMVYETHKILSDDSIAINATTVRVPVFYGHSESVTVTFESAPRLMEVKELLRSEPGVVLMDDADNLEYPTPLEIAGTDDTYVGRIRKDLYDPCTLSMWIVADNLRKGAATNAVQIIEKMEELKNQ
ncbi:MAG: aspartate-semialdehyde dehydrogenase [Tindallia sp. MSAO_Bac2]|nr:MAG: aspartate-semialdehyde dehydrogenase [Tindallia sp. MSAO_Bac2]